MHSSKRQHMKSVSEGKKSPFMVSPREIDFFKQNYPIHYQVLMELVERDEARIAEPAEVKA
jgi:hypothetical protein